jgi:hypothetical protein
LTAKDNKVLTVDDIKKAVKELEAIHIVPHEKILVLREWEIDAWVRPRSDFVPIDKYDINKSLPKGRPYKGEVGTMGGIPVLLAGKINWGCDD